MTITQATAARTIQTITFSGTPQSALHDIRVQLAAIRPYTDRDLARCAAVLAYILSQTQETQTRLLSKLQQLAHGPAPSTVVAAVDVEGVR